MPAPDTSTVVGPEPSFIGYATSSPTDDSVVAVATFENGPATAALSIAWT